MKYEIKAQADGHSADVYINDFIGDWIDDYWGFGVTSKQFIKEIQDLPESVKTIRLHINSPGGDVVSATHIANTIRDQQSHKGRTVEGLIEGAAWSAATIITSATKPTKIADNALMMVHNPWTITLGNAAELRKAADTMDKFRDSIVASYRWKSSLPVEDLVSLMDAETWMDADDAMKNGFVDEKIAGVSAAAAVVDSKHLAKLPKVPEKYQARVQALLKTDSATAPSAAAPPDPTTVWLDLVDGPGTPDASRLTPDEVRAEAAEIVKICTQHDLPEMAAEFLAKGSRLEAVKQRFQHAGEIKKRCVAANMPERAKKFIIADMAPDEVSDALIKIQQACDAPEIDNKNGQPPAGSGQQAKVLDFSKIYETRRQATQKWTEKRQGQQH